MPYRSHLAALGAALLLLVSLPTACSDDSSPGDGDRDSGTPKDSGSGERDTGTPDATPDGSSPADAGTDAAKDAGPPPTHVTGTPECNAYCAKLKQTCNSDCHADTCKIERRQCAASTQKYLDCQTRTGQWYCGSSGHSIVHSCKYDTALCQ